MKKTHLALFASALTSAAIAQDVVVFGDSLSDVGQTGWLNKATYNQPNGTPNALYNEHIAKTLGSTLTASSKGGSNYAYSGGVVVPTNSQYTNVQPNVAVAQQIQNYLANGVKNDALHVMWAGGNDMPAILTKAIASQDALQTVQTESTVAAQNSAQQWAALKQSGVTLLVAPTVPNVAYTPSLFQQFGTSAASSFAAQTGYGEMAKEAFQDAFDANLAALNNTTQTNLADFENARMQVLANTVGALYQSSLGSALSAVIDQKTFTNTLLQQYQQFATQAASATSFLNSATTQALNSVGGNVVRIDTDALFADMLSNPADFGLTNTTATVCASTTQVVCTPTDQTSADGKLFADGFHPGAVAHKVMADYILNVLQAPSEVSVLPQLALYSTEKTFDFARQQSNSNRLLKQETNTVQGIAAYQRYNEGDAIYAGLKAQFTPQWQFSALFSQSDLDGSKGSTKGEIKSKAINTAVRYDADKWWVGAALQLSDNDYKTSRQIQLGSAKRSQKGETSGAVISASVFGGYEWKFDQSQVALLADLTNSHGKVTDFGETEANAMRLSFEEQQIRSVRSGVGAEYRYQFTDWQPYVNARWVKEWRDSPAELVTTFNNSKFKVGLAQADKSWVNVQAGLDWKAKSSPWHFQLAVQRDLGRRDNFSGTSFHTNVGYQF
ncbi:autotransporter domain-containing esterase [Actinobacillus suis]|nr:autotransporter domain-containing esterase [Actinobacillus suis]MCO4168528.1 autotransporter domain-containing esterase [Actinobacillus suis]MCQ9628767.1 autotransporter domain-containing esterase [Actinobacillus suis]MCQ9631298.1 autotransporter domain-containing esterase [Actinobacillus suis]MCQ9711423.1 autotransporter domain-containing esterase [Actinobacillus suis]OQS56086.1 autotransporter domain-containing esterase [Actinobacillus suis]